MARYGDKHSGGRKTKAEELGLAENIQEAFKEFHYDKNLPSSVSKAVWAELFKIGFNKDIDPEKRFPVVKYIDERLHGKEPKAIMNDVNVNHSVSEESIKSFYKNLFDGPDKTT